MTIAEPELRVLRWVKPRDEDKERAQKAFEDIRERMQRILSSNYSSPFDIRLQGSIAKDTWLRNDPEMDIFVIFEEEMSREDFKKIVEKAAKEMADLNPRISYAEHPYLTLSKDGFNIDIVPSLKMKESGRPRTAVDRTPLHTKFVLEHTDENLRDEIRLVKAFMKGTGVYGAEVKVGGFSGYLAELLTIKFGGFRELLDEAAKWRSHVIISFESDQNTIKQLRKRYPESPMILPDPADPLRNVAAALTRKKMAELSLASTLYLERPSLYYFSQKTELLLLEEAKKLPLEIYSDHTVVLDVKLKSTPHPDILWGELKRSSKSIRGILERNNFNVIRCDCWTDERERALIACLIEEKMLEPLGSINGPPFFTKENSIEFLQKYMTIPMAGPWFEDDGRLHALYIRYKRSPLQLLKDRLDEVLAGDLKSGEIRLYRLNSEKMFAEDEASRWLLLFQIGKPRWLLPRYLQELRGETEERVLFQ
ncbi:MAG: CCA tRNA nucleotidyltransferase [Fervidicoccaceae archaeon]